MVNKSATSSLYGPVSLKYDTMKKMKMETEKKHENEKKKEKKKRREKDKEKENKTHPNERLELRSCEARWHEEADWISDCICEERARDEACECVRTVQEEEVEMQSNTPAGLLSECDAPALF